MFEGLVSDLSAGRAKEDIAMRFHRFLAAAMADAAKAWIELGEARAIALSGGCFQNELLAHLVTEELRGLPVLTHKMTPANDGGLALGQAVIAAAQAMDGAESD
jgi:hydrogenase maturation protein HypF